MVDNREKLTGDCTGAETGTEVWVKILNWVYIQNWVKY